MSDFLKHVSDTIRGLRGDMTQEALSSHIGVPANTISRWETGVYKPSVDDLYKLCTFFNIDFGYFNMDRNVILQAKVTCFCGKEILFVGERELSASCECGRRWRFATDVVKVTIEPCIMHPTPPADQFKCVTVRGKPSHPVPTADEMERVTIRGKRK